MIHKMIKQRFCKGAITCKREISRDTVAKYANPKDIFRLSNVNLLVLQPMPTLPYRASMLIEAHELGMHIPLTAIYEEIKKMDYTGSLRWM